MPTRAGLLTSLLGIAMVAFGRIFGLFELFVLGLGAIGLVFLAIGWVWLHRKSLTIDRIVQPAKVHAGSPSRVSLSLTNNRLLPSPVLRVTDDVEGTRGAELELPPLWRGQSSNAVYRLPTDRRGIVRVGPLRLHVVDPFGLARTVRRHPDNVDLLVFPRVDHVPPPPRPGGDDIHLADRRPSNLGRSSDDFYALREYVVGDDLRQVHWPSTARHDEMMVRQDQMPQQGRTTILLDTRASIGDDPTFERMVSAAASLVAACHRRDDLVRLITTGGYDSGFVPHGAGEALLTFLATVSASDRGDLAQTLHLISQTRGSMTAVLGSVGPDDRGLLSADVVKRFAAAVQFTSGGAAALVGGQPLRSLIMVTVGPADDFAGLWSAAVPSPRRAQGVRR